MGYQHWMSGFSACCSRGGQRPRRSELHFHVSQDQTNGPSLWNYRDARLLPHLLHASRNACKTHLETGPPFFGHHVKLRH